MRKFVIALGLALSFVAFDFSPVNSIFVSSAYAAEYKTRISNQAASEAATDTPSWAKGDRPYKTESGNDFAKRLCDAKYGAGKYPTGPGSEYSKIKKFGDRAFQ
jgi:hypothetical protein